MGILARDIRLLFQHSGNRCAFPECTRSLSHPPSDKDGTVATSEVAHIVAESPSGPRGDHPMPMDERNRYENLILLCEKHHGIVDTQVATYPVERLRQMKYDHEALIAEATRKAVETRARDQAPTGLRVVERLYSSLLPVERLPRYVFSIECDQTEPAVKKRLVQTPQKHAAPFICRGKRLYCFQNLRDEPGAFVDVAVGKSSEQEEAASWWGDQDKSRWYVDLLNRTLNKVTGWRGLNLDKQHKRYFFEPDEPGKPKSITYRPMNMATSTIQVVWQPVTRKTNLPKNFWYHRAVAMSFVQVASKSWCLALRPEMRVTRDGVTPIQPRKIGEKVTKKKSRMWNIDVLEELNFWRDFFCEGRSRLIVPFADRTALSVSANFLNQNVRWPGVPPERAREFKNAQVDESLFDLAELDRIDQGLNDYEESDDSDYEDEGWNAE